MSLLFIARSICTYVFFTAYVQYVCMVVTNNCLSPDHLPLLAIGGRGPDMIRLGL